MAVQGRADGSVRITTPLDTTGFTKGINNMKKGIAGLGSSVMKLGGIIGLAFGVKALVDFGKACIDLGSDLDEVQNVVDTVFRDDAEVINKFAKDAAANLGLSELAAKQYTSTLGAMYKSMGVIPEQVTEMSMRMTELTADMASFYNLDADAAFQKIRSGISGETEPLKQLGINMSEANLEQFRMNQGMTTAYSKMTQQEKALLRYNYLLSVTKDAQGDFARTSGSWANQMKVLKLQLDSIKADLGQGFIAILTPVLQVINKILQGLAKLASSFKAFAFLITGKKSQAQNQTTATGIDTVTDSTEDYTQATKDATKATKAARKENDKYLSGLDEIHTYTEKTAADTGKTTAGSGGAGAVPTTAAVDFGTLETGETVVDELAEKMKKMYDTIVDGVQPVIKALQNLWDNGLSRLKDFTWDALKGFYTNFLVPVGKWTIGTGLPRLIDAFNDGLMKTDFNKINTSLNGLWQALAPFATHIGEGLLWFYENVLMPLGVWTSNNVVPLFLDAISAALGIVNTAIEAAKPYLLWIWDNFLQPAAEFTGGLIVDWLESLVATLRTFGDWCSDHIEIVGAITTAVAAFFAAWKFTQLISGIASLIASMNPITLVISGIIAVGVLLIAHWDTVKAKAIEIWGAVKEWIISTWNNVKTKTLWTWEIIKAWLKAKWESIRTAVVETWDAIKKKISSTWTLIKTKATTTWNSIKSGLVKAWNAIKETAVSVWDTLKTAIIGVWDTLKTKATQTWENITATIKTAWYRIKSSVSSLIKEVADGITEKWTALKEGATQTWENITATIKTAWFRIKSSVTSKLAEIKQGIIDKWEGIKTDANEKWASIKGVIDTRWNLISSAAITKFKEIRDEIGKKWDDIKETATEVWDSVKTTVTTTWENIRDSELYQTVAATISSTWATIKDTASRMWSGENGDGGIKGVITGAWDALVDAASRPDGFSNLIAGAIGGAWDTIKEKANTIWGGATGIVQTIKDWWDDLSDAATEVGGNIVSGLVGAFQNVARFVITPINAVIRAVNGLIKRIVHGINSVINAINSLGFDLPDWLGGYSFHPGIPTITRYPQMGELEVPSFGRIPGFAKGAVIPPRAPFLAALGDQKNGRNIETPESLLRQIMREEGGGGDITITVNLDGKVVYENVLKRARRQQQYTGVSPFELA